MQQWTSHRTGTSPKNNQGTHVQVGAGLPGLAMAYCVAADSSGIQHGLKIIPVMSQGLIYINLPTQSTAH